MKNGKALCGNRLTIEMIKLGGNATTEAMEVKIRSVLQWKYFTVACFNNYSEI